MVISQGLENRFIRMNGTRMPRITRIRTDLRFLFHIFRLPKHFVNYNCQIFDFFVNYSWKNHNEVDFIIRSDNKILPVEVKYQNEITGAD